MSNENKIITPSGDAMQTAQPQPVPVRQNMTPQTANEIMGAIFRLGQLGENKIIDTATAAEKRGLHEVIVTRMSAHASELMGAWVAVKSEYEPLVIALAKFMVRVQDQAAGMQLQARHELEPAAAAAAERAQEVDSSNQKSS